MIWARHVADLGENEDACRSLVGKPAGKKPLAKPRCRWEVYTKIALTGIGLRRATTGEPPSSTQCGKFLE
jgi:hypothetical protein